jgi:hypothetical protein
LKNLQEGSIQVFAQIFQANRFLKQAFSWKMVFLGGRNQ